MITSNKGALNPINQTSLLKTLVHHIGFLTPQLYLLLVFSLWIAQDAWQKNFETLTTIEAQQAQQRQINLQREPLNPQQVASIVAKVQRLAPRVTASIDDRNGTSSIAISISQGENLDAFREALLLVLSSDEGTLWSAKELCFGKCTGGAALAVLSGHRQRIEVK